MPNLTATKKKKKSSPLPYPYTATSRKHRLNDKGFRLVAFFVCRCQFFIVRNP